MDGLTNPGLALYIAAIVALIVWLGIFAYLWKIDAQVKTLRRTLESRRPEETTQDVVRPERIIPERKEQTNG